MSSLPASLRRALVGLCAALTAIPLALSGSAAAATTARPGDPIAGMPWGIYKGNADGGVYPAWQAATGTQKRLLARVALQPRVRWFTSKTAASDIAAQIRDYITTTQHGDPNVLVQLATFRLWPNHEDHRSEPLTAAMQAAYRAWVDNAAKGIGNSRVLINLEPDLPVSWTGWQPYVRLRLAGYAARVFGSLPNASVYIDAGAADWMPVSQAVTTLVNAGVRYARGFSLNDTHYDDLAGQIGYGRDVAQALAAAGVPNKHFVVDTSDNGRPFKMHWFIATHPGVEVGEAPECTTVASRQCVTFGVPPTSDVTDPRWGLPQWALVPAQKYCDGYLWEDRPWIDHPLAFDLQRTLNMARTTPFAAALDAAAAAR
jgi:hypothetical protein